MSLLFVNAECAFGIDERQYAAFRIDTCPAYCGQLFFGRPGVTRSAFL